jgi:peptide/nickel transport system permease protein
LSRFARQSHAGFVAGVVLVVFTLTALAAPFVAPNDPIAMNPPDRLLSPGDGGLLGTDVFGRDVLSRIIYGTRISLLVGAVSVFASAIAGTALGLVAGYVGQWPEYLVMRVVDVLFAFPAVLLAILVVSVVGAGLTSIVIAIATVFTPIFAHVVRGSTLAVKNVEFVQAAVAAGATTGRIMVRQSFPMWPRRSLSSSRSVSRKR